MKMLNLIRVSVVLATLSLFFSSCQSSKIAYGNSYYFKQTPKKVAETVVEESQPLASLEVQQPASISAVKRIEASAKRVKALAEEQQHLKDALQTSEETMSRTEKKVLRKEQKQHAKALKQELKTLSKEYKAAPEEVQQQMAEQQVSGNVRTGIILGAAGLVLLIIGGAGVLYTIGSILIVAGLVLILIDIL